MDNPIPILEDVANQQASWSNTANQLKATADRARSLTLWFSSSGALLAAVASQLPEGTARSVVAVAGAAALAVVSFLSARLLNSEHIGRWTRARAAAEALKREAFKFAASAAPYDDPVSRNPRLAAELERIEQDLDDLLGDKAPPEEPATSPTTLISRADYLKLRLRSQVDDFYEPKARLFQRRSDRLRQIEFVLALFATVITAGVALAGKSLLGIPFDLTALTAVLTTVSGAIVAHIESARYDFLVTTYRVTARRLRHEERAAGEVEALSAGQWSALVQRSESILADENSTWTARWTQAQPRSQPTIEPTTGPTAEATPQPRPIP